MGELTVTFYPMSISGEARCGDSLLDVAAACGVELPHSCGGNCFCTSCHVRVLDGAEHLTPMEPPEHERLRTSALRTPNSRLACQALIRGGPVVLELVEDGRSYITIAGTRSQQSPDTNAGKEPS